MHYLVEAVQRNRIIKVIIRTPDYDRALGVFDRLKTSIYRETRFFKHEDAKGKILLKVRLRESVRSTARAAARAANF